MIPNDTEHLQLHLVVPVQEPLRPLRCFTNQPRLLLQDLRSRETWPGKHHNKRDLIGPGSNQGCDQAALAMASKANPAVVNLCMPGKKPDAGQHILGQVERRRRTLSPGRATAPPVIHS